MASVNPTIATYEDMRNKIVNGIFTPAESLREMDLAAQYNVSRNTIKKALLMLEKENLVTMEPNKGAKVRNFSLAEVSEFLELRAELEGFVARLAIPCITEAQIAQMQEILDTMKELLNKGDLMAYSSCNRKFHTIVYEACPNKTAVNMTISLKDQMSKYNAKTILVPGRNQQSFEEHTAILNAIKAKNAELTEMLLRHHVNNVRKTFIDNFSLLF